MRIHHKFITRVAMVLLLVTPPVSASPTRTAVKANTVAEFEFKSSKQYADPFNEIELDVLFTAPDGKKFRVPAFWAGDSVWRVRYSSAQLGVHKFRTKCSDNSNADLHGVEGEVEISPYNGSNPLYVHGPIRVAKDERHFEHIDGTPFLWLADTWWMGLCNRLHFPDEFEKLVSDRTAKGFDVIQIVAGLYPDMPAFDERGANEAGFPWEKDYSRINPAYFDAADKRIAYLADHGLSPCVVGAWGYHLPWLGVEKMKKHWRNIVARWGAYPCFWCLAGEGAMTYYLTPKEKRDAERQFQIEGWTEIGEYVRKIDPWHHPVSIHPTDTARTQVENIRVLDFDMLQTGHSDRASIPNTIRLVRQSRAAKPVMPTVNSEVCYEGILDTCYEEIQRFMVWSCYLSGEAGHTYGANGIWQLNRAGAPYGKSPHGGNWGERPWDDAMNLPGSRQAGMAKKLLEKFEWWKFEPHPEWASYEDAGAGIAWGDWIWYPEGEPAKNAPTEERYFRKTIEIPKAREARLTLRAAADDKLVAWFDGKRLGEHSGWGDFVEFSWTAQLAPGHHALAVMAENRNPQIQPNPAGLICAFKVEGLDHDGMEIKSDGSWRASKEEPENWIRPEFDDSHWEMAKIAAPYGGGPWGKIEASDPYMAPYAAGIPGKLMIIYVPQRTHQVIVQGLKSGTKYRVTFYNPVDGQTNSTEMEVENGQDSWRVPSLMYQSPDCVLVVETTSKR